MAKVTELLAAGANPNAPVGKKKMTAMHRVAASNSSELEDLLVAGGGERRLRALEDAGAEEQMMLERMMSENELGGNSNDINDSSLLAEGDDDDDAAAAAEVFDFLLILGHFSHVYQLQSCPPPRLSLIQAAAGPSADGSDDVDDSPRSKRVSSVDNVTVDDSEVRHHFAPFSRFSRPLHGEFYRAVQNPRPCDLLSGQYYQVLMLAIRFLRPNFRLFRPTATPASTKLMFTPTGALQRPR